MTIVNTKNLAVGALDHGDQRAKLPIADAQSVNGNLTITSPVPLRELLIINDDPVNPITFTVTGKEGYSVSFTLQPLNASDERYYPFYQVVVNAISNWRYILRCGLIQ